MTLATPQKGTNKVLTATLAALMALGVSACGGDDDNDPVMGPDPTPPPPPPPSSVTYDVGQCLNQTVPGTGGQTVANIAIPDVLRINPSAPAGFPNGRKLADPVIDVTLAVLFLDINASGQSPATFAELPLNPPANDVAFRDNFPFLAPPQGSPSLASGTGSNFNFRTESANSYVRVDRMGIPALSTALIPSDTKIAYNDAGPVDDASGQFVDPIVETLTALTQGIGPDLIDLGLNICAD